MGRGERVKEECYVPFKIEATTATGTVSVECQTPAETLRKVQELEQQPHGQISVKDRNGRAINVDNLIALCDPREVT